MLCCGFGAGLAAVGVIALVLGSCNRVDHPPPPAAQKPPRSVPEAGIVVLDAALGDGPPTCGGQTLAAVTNPPLLYFVLDRSGSMGQPIDDGNTSKYSAAQTAVGEVLDSIGHRVRYGAVVYPASDEDGSCQPGRQVFPPTLGDPPSPGSGAGRGTVLRAFMNRIAAFQPGGATPTAATLESVLPNLSGAAERMAVVLVTDGAPNCDADLACPSSSCIPDIEGGSFQGLPCGPARSCCDPALLGPGAGGNCIDGEATVAAVLGLAEAGIDTYVVGMPGSEAYSSLLERLAVAGGQARARPPAYYAVSDASALTQALFEIGTGLAIQCEIQLESTPPDPELVNLYFDDELVGFDPENGWDFSSASALSVRGNACETLRSGSVREVQIAYGCRTVVR
jgi:hypothetical protein